MFLQRLEKQNVIKGCLNKFQGIDSIRIYEKSMNQPQTHRNYVVSTQVQKAEKGRIQMRPSVLATEKQPNKFWYWTCKTQLYGPKNRFKVKT